MARTFSFSPFYLLSLSLSLSFFPPSPLPLGLDSPMYILSLCLPNQHLPPSILFHLSRRVLYADVTKYLVTLSECSSVPPYGFRTSTKVAGYSVWRSLTLLNLSRESLLMRLRYRKGDERYEGGIYFRQ